MAEGPGKYDDICTHVRETVNAQTALVIVIGGNKGTGFSMQTIYPSTVRVLPKLLRDVADQIEKDVS